MRPSVRPKNPPSGTAIAIRGARVAVVEPLELVRRFNSSCERPCEGVGGRQKIGAAGTFLVRRNSLLLPVVHESRRPVAKTSRAVRSLPLPCPATQSEN